MMLKRYRSSKLLVSLLELCRIHCIIIIQFAIYYENNYFIFIVSYLFIYCFLCSMLVLTKI